MGAGPLGDRPSGGRSFMRGLWIADKPDSGGVTQGRDWQSPWGGRGHPGGEHGAVAEDGADSADRELAYSRPGVAPQSQWRGSRHRLFHGRRERPWIERHECDNRSTAHMITFHLAIILVTVAVGVGVLRANPERGINRAFSFLSATIAVWLIGLAWLTNPTNQNPIAWIRFTNPIAPFSPCLLWIVKNCAKAEPLNWRSI